VHVQLAHEPVDVLEYREFVEAHLEEVAVDHLEEESIVEFEHAILELH